MAIHLMAETGPLAGGYWDYPGPVRVEAGRDAGAALPLAGDATASRRHARFEFDPPAARVRDLGSRNGLFVNGAHFPPGAAAPPLGHGDRVQVGASVFRVFVPYCEVCAATVPPPFAGQGPLVCAQCEIRRAPRAAGFGHRRARERAAPPAVPGHVLLQLLSRGAMGEVYLARREADGKLATVKAFARAVDAPGRTEAFLRRVESLAAMRHPHLVRIDGGGVSGRQWYLLREYVPGWTLEGWRLAQPDKRLPPAVVAPLIGQALDALGYMHACGIAHRHLQPSHVLLDVKGPAPVVKLADLDVATPAGLSARDLVLVDAGTGRETAFIAPEQATDFASGGPAADLFSLAATFYTALTGAPVYDFDGAGDPTTAFFEGRIVPAAARPAKLPPGFAAWLDRALSLDPAGRYPAAAAMRAAFDALRGG